MSARYSRRREVGPGLQFEILGPLRVTDNGRTLVLGPRKQQLVLAVLLCHANSTVSVNELVDALWADGPPPSARKNIQVYISGLRCLLDDAATQSRISYRASGYAIRADTAELDWLTFDHKVQESRRICRTDPVDVAHVLATALDLWRGHLLEGMRGIPAIAAAAKRLESRVLAAFEDWAETEVAAGHAWNVIDRITSVAVQHPFRERLSMVQMTALVQVSRRTEALAVYDDLRRHLATEFGISPSPALLMCYESLLREDQPTVSRSPARPLRRSSRLPRDLPAFTGRAACAGLLANAVTTDGEQLAVVTGPVGSGKTALAVHVAHQLREHFPDGCILARLRADDGTVRPAEQVLGHLLADVAAVDPRADPAAAWQRWLAGHRALVVLDHADGDAAIMQFLPEAGDSAVIVTSRASMTGLGSAHRMVMPAFSLAEAVEFLGRVIGSERVTRDLRSAERIVLATGLLPLAVRVIADRLAWLRHVPLYEYVGRIDTATALLAELTVAAPAVRVRFAAAIAELPETVRAVIPCLVQLSRRFTLAEAAHALGRDEGTTLQVLETLLEASVLTVPGGEVVARAVVYEMPLAVHAYARGCYDGR